MSNVICSFSVPQDPKEERLVEWAKKEAKDQRRTFSFIMLEAIRHYKLSKEAANGN